MATGHQSRSTWRKHGGLLFRATVGSEDERPKGFRRIGVYEVLVWNLYIVLLLIAGILVGLARHGRRGFRKYLRGNVDERIVLTDLAARTSQKVNFAETVNERTFLSSIVAGYTLDSVTPATDDGPVMVGLAHSDYTQAEIEEWIDNVESWNEGDLVGQEVAKRKIKLVGIFDQPSGPTDSIPLNEGKKIKTKCNWVLLQGQTVALWAFNMGQSAFATTAPIAYIQGHANLWPQ